jgi:O-antigen/teichoic acid export membrane protein
MIASAGAAFVALAAVTIKLGWPHFKPLLAMKHVGEGVEYSFAASTTSAYNDLDKTMLSHYGMAAANGIYGLAYRVIDVGTTPLVAIQLASEPRLFQLAESGTEGPIKLGRRLLRHGIMVSAAAALAMFLFAPVLPMLTGKGFVEAIAALRWLCLIPVFRSIHQMSGSALTGAGQQKYRTTSQCIAAALNFGLNLYLIPKYNWWGAAWASLITDGGLGMINVFMLSLAIRVERKKLAMNPALAAED